VHHSGSGWLARPSPWGTFTSYPLPAFLAHSPSGQSPPPSVVPGGDGTCFDNGRQRARSAIALGRTDALISIALRAARPGNHAQGVVSASHTKNDVHDALHFAEPLRVQFVGYLHVFVIDSGDLEREAYGCEFD